MALDSLSRVNKHMSSDRGGFRQKVNVPVLVAWLCLLAYGSLVIWTASLTIAEASFTRQLVGIGLGAILAFLCWRSDFSGLAGMTTILLVVDLIVLFSPYIPGLSYNAKGMTGWIKIPLIGLTFQPVELAKIITIFFMASLGAQYNGRIDSVREYAKLCGMLAIPFGAAVVAGDLGSGLVVFFSGACIIMMSGPKKEWVLCTIALLVGAVSLLLALDSVLDSMLGKDVLLKQYQMNRLLVFINPESDTSQSGYNLLQSMIAVGSGGFFGKGIGNASQSGAGFCPRRIPISSSPCSPRCSASRGRSSCLRSSPCSSSAPFASPISRIHCSCNLPASASWACGRFSSWRRWGCALGSCPSPAFPCPSSASAHRPC